MLNKIWHYDSYDAEHRTLVDRLIASSPKLQQRFQNTLVAIVQHIFNPVAFQKVVESYYERYQPEAQWDYSFTRPYTRVRMVPDWRYNDFLVAFNNSLPGLPWGLYEWVSLRAEALKKEFCISWEGDENPPDESCVPFQPYPEDAVIATFGEKPTTTLVPIETIATETTSLVVETTTSEIVETTTRLVEPTTTAIVEEPTTTTIEEPTPIQSTKSLPQSRNRFLDWFKNKRPMDIADNVNRSKELNEEINVENEVNNEVKENIDNERNVNGQHQWNFNGQNQWNVDGQNQWNVNRQNQWNFNGGNEVNVNVENEGNVNANVENEGNVNANVENEGNVNEENIDWNNFDWNNVDWNNFQF